MTTLLVVPLLTTSGSSHTVSVENVATIGNVIDVAISCLDLRSEVLGHLAGDHGWAMQRVRREKQGKVWVDGEMECIGDGESSCCSLNAFPMLRRDCATEG